MAVRSSSSGTNFNASSQVNLGLGSFAAANLGNVTVDASGNVQDNTLASLASGGQNSLLASTDRTRSAAIVSAAINQVSSAQAQIGAIQSNTIQGNLQALQVGQENLSSARSSIVRHQLRVSNGQFQPSADHCAGGYFCLVDRELAAAERPQVAPIITATDLPGLRETSAPRLRWEIVG